MHLTNSANYLAARFPTDFWRQASVLTPCVLPYLRTSVCHVSAVGFMSVMFPCLCLTTDVSVWLWWTLKRFTWVLHFCQQIVVKTHAGRNRKWCGFDLGVNRMSVASRVLVFAPHKEMKKCQKWIYFHDDIITYWRITTQVMTSDLGFSSGSGHVSESYLDFVFVGFLLHILLVLRSLQTWQQRESRHRPIRADEWCWRPANGEHWADDEGLRLFGCPLSAWSCRKD